MCYLFIASYLSFSFELFSWTGVSHLGLLPATSDTVACHMHFNGDTLCSFPTPNYILRI